jgi:hypothetical protein
MDPAFPDIVEKWAADQIDGGARVWMVTCGADGRLDPDLLGAFGDAPSLQEVVGALVTAAAEQDIAETRIW